LNRDLDIGSCNWFTSGQKRPRQNDFCANIFWFWIATMFLDRTRFLDINNSVSRKWTQH
jgi:hypothetical protein